MKPTHATSAARPSIGWLIHAGARSSCAICLLALASGCGPKTLLPVPATLPERLGVRRMWHTPRAYIYARDKAIAGETDRWIAEIADYVERVHQQKLGKGLVVVHDKGEQPCLSSFDDVVRLFLDAEKFDGVSDESAPGPPKPPREKLREVMNESGMTEHMLRTVMPLPLDDAALQAIGLDAELIPDDIAWRLTAASHRSLEAAVWEFGPKASERAEGKAAAVLMAWAYPIVFPLVAKGLRLPRDTLVFAMWSAKQASWTPDRRKNATERFTVERARAIGPIFASAASTNVVTAADP